MSYMMRNCNESYCHNYHEDSLIEAIMSYDISGILALADEYGALYAAGDSIEDVVRAIVATDYYGLCRNFGILA